MNQTIFEREDFIGRTFGPNVPCKTHKFKIRYYKAVLYHCHLDDYLDYDWYSETKDGISSQNPLNDDWKQKVEDILNTYGIPHRWHKYTGTFYADLHKPEKVKKEVWHVIFITENIYVETHSDGHDRYRLRKESK